MHIIKLNKTDKKYPLFRRLIPFPPGNITNQFLWCVLFWLMKPRYQIEEDAKQNSKTPSLTDQFLPDYFRHRTCHHVGFKVAMFSQSSPQPMHNFGRYIYLR